jgi:hypothetical protein
MPHFKPAPDALCDLDYTPQFYCQCCGAGVPAQSISERKADGGVVREISCPVCRCRERVGIQLAEDFSGWVFFQPEAPAQPCAPDADTDNAEPAQ